MIKKVKLPFTIPHVFLRYYRYDFTKKQIEFFNRYLTFKEKENVKFKGKCFDRKAEYTLSRILVKKLYYDLYKDDGIAILNDYNNCPKLYDKFQKQLQLNVGIAHDSKDILVGISSDCFGIDCQKNIHFDNNQIGYYFSKDEIGYALLSNSVYRTLTLIWGIKESYIKYRQNKSFGYMKNINVRIKKACENILWVLINNCIFIVHYYFYKNICICCLNQ